MKFFAPAKVNLCLHVNGKRADGYHDLCMIMQKISLFDELDIEVTEKAGVVFSSPDDLGPVEHNLVVRAAKALLRYDVKQRGVKIVLKKNIPVAAGLGGGSSDAATTLVALNTLLDLGLQQQLLNDEALSLGADVPFFLYDSCAWATGIGDHLQPVEIVPQFWLLLINPGDGVSTAQVYGALSGENYSVCQVVSIVSSEQALVALLHNDLELTTLSMCPAVGRLKQELMGQGAAGVLMSGSGPTVFGLFFHEESARAAQQQLFKTGLGWSYVAKPF